MISTKGRYALRVMIDLAQHPDSEDAQKAVAALTDKLETYRKVHVREYWLIMPDKRTVIVYKFDI